MHARSRRVGGTHARSRSGRELRAAIGAGKAIDQRAERADQQHQHEPAPGARLSRLDESEDPGKQRQDEGDKQQKGSDAQATSGTRRAVRRCRGSRRTVRGSSQSGHQRADVENDCTDAQDDNGSFAHTHSPRRAHVGAASSSSTLLRCRPRNSSSPPSGTQDAWCRQRARSPTPHSLPPSWAGVLRLMNFDNQDR